MDTQKLHGARHSQGGIHIEAEGGERIFSREDTKQMENLAKKNKFEKLGKFIKSAMNTQDSRDTFGSIAEMGKKIFANYNNENDLNLAPEEKQTLNQWAHLNNSISDNMFHSNIMRDLIKSISIDPMMIGVSANTGGNIGEDVSVGGRARAGINPMTKRFSWDIGANAIADIKNKLSLGAGINYNPQMGINTNLSMGYRFENGGRVDDPTKNPFAEKRIDALEQAFKKNINNTIKDSKSSSSYEKATYELNRLREILKNAEIGLKDAENRMSYAKTQNDKKLYEANKKRWENFESEIVNTRNRLTNPKTTYPIVNYYISDLKKQADRKGISTEELNILNDKIIEARKLIEPHTVGSVYSNPKLDPDSFNLIDVFDKDDYRSDVRNMILEATGGDLDLDNLAPEKFAGYSKSDPPASSPTALKGDLDQQDIIKNITADTKKTPSTGTYTGTSLKKEDLKDDVEPAEPVDYYKNILDRLKGEDPTLGLTGDYTTKYEDLFSDDRTQGQRLKDTLLDNAVNIFEMAKGVEGMQTNLPRFMMSDSLIQQSQELFKRAETGLTEDQETALNRDADEQLTSTMNALTRSGLSSGQILGYAAKANQQRTDNKLKIQAMDERVKQQYMDKASQMNRYLENQRYRTEFMPEFEQAMMDRSAAGQLFASGRANIEDKLMHEKMFGKGTPYDALLKANVQKAVATTQDMERARDLAMKRGEAIDDQDEEIKNIMQTLYNKGLNPDDPTLNIADDPNFRTKLDELLK